MDTAETSAAHAVPGQSARPPPPRARRRQGRWIAWVMVSIAVIGAVAFALRQRSRHGAPPIHYETAVVDQGPISARVTATGTLSALVTVTVGSQVSGTIESLSADFGSQVDKGQVVATIEPSLFKSAVAQARATLLAARAQVTKARADGVQARRVYDRGKGLASQSLISTQDLEVLESNVWVADATLEAAQASVSQAAATLRQAEQNLEYCTIRSPIDGVVISRSVDVGQTVAAAFQAPVLFTIAQDLTKMQVDTNVAEADVGKIRPGMAVTFTVDAHPTRSFPGVVRQVRDNAQTVQNVVTYDAVVDVDNSERLLKPGMTATVTFAYASRKEALRLRNAALRFRPTSSLLPQMLGGPSPVPIPRGLGPDERLVWVIRGDRAVPVKIKIGISDGDNTEVLGGGLQKGDRVVTEALRGGGASHAPI